MTLGKLIAQKGSSAQVRDFGATLAKDHSDGLVQAQQLARQLHLNIRPSMAPEARTERTKLQHLRGTAFDMEVKRYMVHDHEKDLAEFRAQARSGDRPTANFATQTMPVLQKHLEMARSIRS
jgi:putative membrane protein